MKRLIDLFKVQLQRKQTIPIASVGILFLLISFLLGISDNPPGIWMAMAGLTLLAFSFVHHWREPSKYGTLFAVSAIAFPVLVLLHNIFEGLNMHLGPIPVIYQLFNGLSVIAFIAAVLIIPGTAVVGFLGGVFWLVKGWISPEQES